MQPSPRPQIIDTFFQDSKARADMELTLNIFYEPCTDVAVPNLFL